MVVVVVVVVVMVHTLGGKCPRLEAARTLGTNLGGETGENGRWLCGWARVRPGFDPLLVLEAMKCVIMTGMAQKVRDNDT